MRAWWPDDEGGVPVSIFIFYAYHLAGIPFPTTNAMIRRN